MSTNKAANGGCAFTGHRELGEISFEKLHDLLDRAIAYAYKEGCRHFYNGGALGFDLVAAERVLTFREKHPDARLVMLLPCKGQDARWTFLQKREYRSVLARADEVHYVSEEYDEGCMRRRNEALVRNADMLIAYLSHMRSGAAQTVAMAKRKGIAVYNLYGK